MQFDKENELGLGIAIDLEGLAAVSLQQDDEAAAIDLLQRALRLHLYNNNKVGACDVLSRLQSLCPDAQFWINLPTERVNQLQCD